MVTTAGGNIVMDSKIIFKKRTKFSHAGSGNSHSDLTYYYCFQGCKVELVSESCQSLNVCLLLIFHHLLGG